jgi:hypothetical protein
LLKKLGVRDSLQESEALFIAFAELFASFLPLGDKLIMFAGVFRETVIVRVSITFGGLFLRREGGS